MILCGWCGKQTANLDRCTSCGHRDPTQPYDQRGDPAPTVRLASAGRPALNPATTKQRLGEARTALGPAATQAQIAEFLGVSEKTVRRWQQTS